MYRYEMHQHTAGCSACAEIEADKLIPLLKQQGFAGMVLTNHFFHGNTAIRRQIPWADFVRAYEEDWLRAKELGDRLDFDVLFGIEEWVGDGKNVLRVGGKEVLLYGITPQTLYDHPELRNFTHSETYLKALCDMTHEAGGLVMQAHPFRVRDYIANPWEPLPTAYLDGMETYNACNSPLENRRAEQYAEAEGLIPVAGTDAHHTDTYRYGIVTERRLRTGEDLIDVLTNGDYDLYIPE
ncbi:MAG: hypothetical protein IJO76_02390 [Clostridia bacterium]|nr:hypothetical protein [Clostridia bacterium]